MNKYIVNLQQKKADLGKEADAIFNAAQADDRKLTEEERQRCDVIEDEIKSINDDIKRAQRQEDREREIIIESQKQEPHKEDQEAETTGKKHFFTLLGEFAQCVISASRPGGPVFKAAASGMNTLVGSEGGFLVDKQLSTMLLERAMEASMLASRCARVPIGEGFDGLKAPYIDETSRATGSRWGGVRAYWTAQADTVTASKPKLGKFELDLEKLMALCYLTDESMRDATALGAILAQAFTEEFSWVLDDAILFGSGAGQPLGIMNSGAKIEVAKETGQAAATIVAQNIIKMRARLMARNRGNSVWLVNQDAEPQLHQMSLPVGTGGVPVYLPASGLAGGPFDTLYGRAVLPIEQAQTLGTAGDIVYCDLSQYLLIEKGGVEQAESMHVRFLYGENTLRWTQRINGAPKLKSAVTAAKGTVTYSPFVALAARS